MPLTHVCVWDPNAGYRRVTIEEACELHPYGASAGSGHFICELCAQNVLLTAPGAYIQHFRHDPSSPNKECDERQAYFDPTYGRALKSLNSHVMPLRITVVGKEFSFQLGFFNPPDINAYCSKIKILGDSHQKYEYSFDRIEAIGTTYLNVGDIPSQNYWLEYTDANSALKKYWSNKVPGVYSKGSFFDISSGKMLQLGGKANAHKPYYLLQRRPLYYQPDIDIKEVARTQSNSSTSWYLYRITVKTFSIYSAQFFLKYSIFLTESPTKYYPIWPAYVENPYFIQHNSAELYLYLCGDDAELKTFPATCGTSVHQLDAADGGKLCKINTREKEQLISIGKSGALGFSYLLRNELKLIAPVPEVHIEDSYGTILDQEVYSSLPKSNRIIVTAQFDGKVVFLKNGSIQSVSWLSADQAVTVDHLSFGSEIHIFQGCDRIRRIKFERNCSDLDAKAIDIALVKELNATHGNVISISHSFGTIGAKLDKYPQTKMWVYASLRNGKISRDAYQILVNFINGNNWR